MDAPLVFPMSDDPIQPIPKPLTIECDYDYVRKRSDTLDSATLFSDTTPGLSTSMSMSEGPSSFSSFAGGLAVNRNDGYEDDIPMDLDLDLNIDDEGDNGKGKGRAISLDVSPYADTEMEEVLDSSSPGAGPSTPFSNFSFDPPSVSVMPNPDSEMDGGYFAFAHSSALSNSNGSEITVAMPTQEHGAFGVIVSFNTQQVSDLPTNPISFVTPPTLPPLEFTSSTLLSPLSPLPIPFSSNAELGNGHVPWRESPTPVPPPPPPTAEEEQAPLLPPPPPPPRQEDPTPPPTPFPPHLRPRSLSSLSLKSTRSLTLSIKGLKHKLSFSSGAPSPSQGGGSGSGTLVKRIFRKKGEERRGSLARMSSTPMLRVVGPVPDPKGKGKQRAYTSPLPLPLAVSAIVPEPPSEPEPRQWPLPPELTTEVLACLIYLHVRAYEDYVAGKGPLVGREREKEQEKEVMWLCAGGGTCSGLREVVKATRVSNHFATLLRPSPLFASLALSSAPFTQSSFPSIALLHLIRERGGTFLRSLDIGYQKTLSGPALVRIFKTSPSSSSSSSLTTSLALTSINLEGCANLDSGSLGTVFKTCITLRKVNLRGLGEGIVNDSFIRSLASSPSAPYLTNLNISRCRSVTGSAIAILASACSKMKFFRLAGITLVSEEEGVAMCKAIGRGMPDLLVLDLSGIEELTDDAVEALVDISSGEAEDVKERKERDSTTKVVLSPRDAGHPPNSGSSYTEYTRRVLSLKHISLSSCTLLTDSAAYYLAHAVPNLQFLELGNIGEGMGDNGVCALLRTTPAIRKVDLEGSGVGDAVLECLTPRTEDEGEVANKTGSELDHLVLSSLTLPSNPPLQALIRTCTKLRVLEVDSTRASQSTIREFIRYTRRRELKGAEIVAIDCRSVGDTCVRDLAIRGEVRTRRGWRGYEAISTKLGYTSEGAYETKMGMNEYDDSRVVFKCFWSWQAVDAARLLAASKDRDGFNGSGGESSGSKGRSKLRRLASDWSRRNGSDGAEEDERGCVVM